MHGSLGRTLFMEVLLLSLLEALFTTNVGTVTESNFGDLVIDLGVLNPADGLPVDVKGVTVAIQNPNAISMTGGSGPNNVVSLLEFYDSSGDQISYPLLPATTSLPAVVTIPLDDGLLMSVRVIIRFTGGAVGNTITVSAFWHGAASPIPAASRLPRSTVLQSTDDAAGSVTLALKLGTVQSDARTALVTLYNATEETLTGATLSFQDETLAVYGAITYTIDNPNVAPGKTKTFLVPLTAGILPTATIDADFTTAPTTGYVTGKVAMMAATAADYFAQAQLADYVASGTSAGATTPILLNYGNTLAHYTAPTNGTLNVAVALSAAATLSMSRNAGAGTPSYNNLNGGTALAATSEYAFSVPVRSGEVLDFEVSAAVDLNAFDLFFVPSM